MKKLTSIQRTGIKYLTLFVISLILLAAMVQTLARLQTTSLWVPIAFAVPLLAIGVYALWPLRSSPLGEDEVF